MRQRLEKSVQSAALKRLRKIPYSWWIKVNDRSSIGYLDIYGAINGDSFVIEMKRKGEKLTRLQLKKALEYRRCQTFVYVVDEENFEEVISTLEEFGYKHLLNPLYQLEAIPERFEPAMKKPRPLRKGRGPKK